MNSRDFEVAFKHLVEYIFPDGNITNTVSNEWYNPGEGRGSILVGWLMT